MIEADHTHVLEPMSRQFRRTGENGMELTLEWIAPGHGTAVGGHP